MSGRTVQKVYFTPGIEEQWKLWGRRSEADLEIESGTMPGSYPDIIIPLCTVLRYTMVLIRTLFISEHSSTNDFFFICFSVKFWGLQGVCSSLREKPYNHLKIRDFSYPSPFHWRTFTFVCHFKYNLMPSKTWRAQHGRHVVADGLIPPHWQHIATLRSGQWTYGPSLVMWGLLFIRRTLSNVSSLRI